MIKITITFNVDEKNEIKKAAKQPMCVQKIVI